VTTPVDPGAGEGPAVPPPGSGEGPAGEGPAGGPPPGSGEAPPRVPAATNRTGVIVGIVVAILIVLGGGAALIASMH
jgi:hypothetical protein